MSSTTELVRSMTIYGGIPIFACGIIGNLLNIRFLWRTRRNPCAFIFLSSSIINCLVLFYGLFTRILSVGFNLDWSSNNLIWCKARIAFTQASFFMSLTCVCLASIDRFFASCRDENYRRLSRLSYAICGVLLTCLFWLAHSTCEFIYGVIVTNPITGLSVCSVVSPQEFTNYRMYVSLPIYLGVLPTLILTISGFLTYRNINKLQGDRQREIIQKQLTRMMLIQIPIILFSTIPYIIYTEYAVFSATTPKTTEQRMIESITSSVLTLLFYISFASSFFVFFTSSKSFRHEAKLFFSCQKQDPNGTNQIQPYSTAESRQAAIQVRTNMRELRVVESKRSRSMYVIFRYHWCFILTVGIIIPTMIKKDTTDDRLIEIETCCSYLSVSDLVTDVASVTTTTSKATTSSTMTSTTSMSTTTTASSVTSPSTTTTSST
ncbi:hypothetical protein I4U23_023382 [Adineta vaga]|nr:hypothetical protein I4U23_023382 [Adineta vaga]